MIGHRVRIRPQGRADVMDLALEGKIAVIESIEQDAENRVYLALVLDEDPGKDLGMLRQPGHRFFYGVNEVEPLTGSRMSRPSKILVAGIGNIFLGDDAFGSEVARQLMDERLPPEVRVIDFGIRTYDLAYAIMDGYDVTILVDITAQGQSPGTVYLIEPDLNRSSGQLRRRQSGGRPQHESGKGRSKCCVRFGRLSWKIVFDRVRTCDPGSGRWTDWNERNGGKGGSAGDRMDQNAGQRSFEQKTQRKKSKRPESVRKEVNHMRQLSITRAYYPGGNCYGRACREFARNTAISTDAKHVNMHPDDRPGSI